MGNRFDDGDDLTNGCIWIFCWIVMICFLPFIGWLFGGLVP